AFFDWLLAGQHYDSRAMRRCPSPDGNPPERLKLLFFLLLTAGLTGCTNFYGKGIQYQIEHRYAVNDPQFVRSMGSLVEPALPAGRVWPTSGGATPIRRSTGATRCLSSKARPSPRCRRPSWTTG